MTTQSEKPRAPQVTLKLESARSVLQDLNRGVAEAALAAAENASGAQKRLGDLRAKIGNAERDVAELERALDLAQRLDRESLASAVVVMRQEQFGIMKKYATSRLKKAAIVMEALATAAKAYSEYAIETNAMVVALPTGTRMPFMGIGRYGGSWVGDLKPLISAEAYRVTFTDENGKGARLPFAQASRWLVPWPSHSDRVASRWIAARTRVRSAARRDLQTLGRANDGHTCGEPWRRISYRTCNRGNVRLHETRKNSRSPPTWGT